MSKCIKCKNDPQNVKSETNPTPKLRYATYNIPGGKPMFCSDHKTKQMINTRSKKCEKQGCSTVCPTFNIPGKKTGIRCKKHILDGMVNVSIKDTKTCQKEGCTIQSYFNYPGKKNGIYCKKHAPDGCINVLRNTCRDPGCSTVAQFNEIAKKGGLYCSKHVAKYFATYANMTIKHCLELDCVKVAQYNELGKEDALYCRQHVAKYFTKYANTVIKLCREPDCTVIPCFNTPGEKIGIYCIEHAIKNLESYVLITRTCVKENCSNRPSFNQPGETIGLYCKTDAPEGCINVRSKNCLEPGCRIQPAYNEPGKTVGIYCSEHGKSHLNQSEDVVNKRCDTCQTRRRSWNYSNSESASCAQCYWDNVSNVLKDKTPKQINNILQKPKYLKFKEVHVTQYLMNAMPTSEWPLCYQKMVVTHNGQLPPKRYFVDAECKKSGFVIVIENDEEQHRSTSCDLQRIADVTAAYGCHTVFIRFNPDSYTNMNNKRIQGMFTRVKDELRQSCVFESRMKKLVKVLKTYAEFDTCGKPLTHIAYINYNVDSATVVEAKTIFGEEQVRQIYI